ncbi:YjbE family putative metal transport protein [Rhodopila sp.]|jgi:YjbE family integral membrane protein|uniref:YjbE family putative metal transport protein n=1 Tax=Rhodopila sp. TaxID=2480087 RepID=UPI002B6EEC2D|nr:YjbE family putative metal transport protein [Rhodopila sp.]HVZ09444.1 YjbE family putative metal transport protein [Rhodopila sp.]
MNWTQDLLALAQVILIDLALAGDNAVVVGMAVAGLPANQKRPAILLGIGGATVIRIALGAVAIQLLAIIGLLLAGGLLLLWVCWRMFRELRAPHGVKASGGGRTLRGALLQIILADVSMSLDNVLAVAGAAHERLWVLATGLVFSVVLMGLAANLVAALLERYRWIAWLGLLIVLYVALSMIWDGAHDVAGMVDW